MTDNLINWTNEAGFEKGVCISTWRYAIVGEVVLHCGADRIWSVIGIDDHGHGKDVAEKHWQDLWRLYAVAELGLTTYRHVLGMPPPKPAPTRRTLWVNGETLTGEVRSISTHTHSDGTQSVDISFVPDEAADTVRLIESMGVEK